MTLLLIGLGATGLAGVLSWIGLVCCMGSARNDLPTTIEDPEE